MKDSFKNRFFKFMNDNPFATNEEIATAFPGEKKNKIRSYKHMYKKQSESLDSGQVDNADTIDTDGTGKTNQSDQNEYETGDSEEVKKNSIDAGTSTSNVTDTTSNHENAGDSTDTIEGTRDESKDSTGNRADTNADIQSFLVELYEHRETILSMIHNQGNQSSGSVLPDIKIEKPFKTVRFNMSESLVNDFIKICQGLRISQRKAIHLAVKEFINRYGQSDD